MLLPPLNLSFHPTSRLRPLIQAGLCLFVSALLLQGSILVFKPNSFKTLLSQTTRRIVVKVAGAALKSILLTELHLLWLFICHIHGVKRIEWRFLNSTLCFRKRCQWSCRSFSCLGFFRGNHIVHTAHMSCHEP